MYRLFLLFLLMSVGGIVFSQSITIKGIEKDIPDLSASVGLDTYAPDGICWPIIKFRTMEKGFQIDAGTVHPKVEYKIGEVWIYVQPRTRFLTIAHEKFGKSNTLNIIPPCESSTVYQLDVEMIAADGKNANVIYDKIVSIAVEPNDAMVYINDELHNTRMGEVQKKLEYGRYNLRVESSMYYSHQQQFVVDDNLQPIKIQLTPNFGWLQITTTPENGADVFVNNKLQSGKSPFKTESLTSGEYTIVVKKELYNTATATATVKDGETTNVVIDMPANFAEVTIGSAIEGVDIYLDNSKIGTSTWKGRLADGVYTVEGRKDKHRTDKQSIKVTRGVAQTVKLNPEPITGTLDIFCVPSGSDIKIDGKSYGLSPQSISNMLVGSYEVVLTKQGFGTERRQITVEEGKTTTIEVTLSSGKNITITSTPSGASLYVDGKSVGVTPQQLSLNYGEHIFKIVDSKGKASEQKYTISETGPSSYELKTGLDEVFTVKEVSFKMIAVEGGTFQMGEEGIAIATPVHSVTLSDYWIGETEITQALWKAVMGSNPSNKKGNNLPVENVNWNDCQEFIAKLNQMTGKQFRLPTEAEWEYAARGGNKSKGYKYSGSNTIEDVAWYNGNSNNKTHSVKTKQSNELGIYDMSGNVWEWCSDFYGSYRSNAQTNPTGPASGSIRVLRGGSWGTDESGCRVPIRNSEYYPDRRYFHVGVRVALVQ